MTLIVARGRQVASCWISWYVEAADVKLWGGSHAGCTIEEGVRENLFEGT